MSELFTSGQLRRLELSNRIIVSPMCQYSAVEGNASAWHHAHLGSLVLGGAALLMVEATAVTPEGRITPGCLGLWSNANEAALEGLLAGLRAVSAMPIGIQLSHAGRKGSSEVPWRGGQLIAPGAGGWHPCAPSPLAHQASEPAPRELSGTEIAALAGSFARAAERAVRLGFDAIELHAAHGYLLHQFLSPVANQRTDGYGGSLQNRMRFPLEVFEAVRRVVPENIPVGVRISATDWLETAERPSWRLEDSVAFALELKARGVDWIDVSSAGISPDQKIVVGPGYQVPFAQSIRQATGVSTIAVGMITEPAQAQSIIASGQADYVALARAMLYDPRWAWHAAAALGGTVRGAPQYWRAVPRAAAGVFGDTPIGQR